MTLTAETPQKFRSPPEKSQRCLYLL